MEPLFTITSWQQGLAIYGGAFGVGVLFTGIVVGLDSLSHPRR